MRANNIVKIMMSAAVMASVASGRVMAEEIEETNGYNEIQETGECEETKESKAQIREIGPGIDTDYVDEEETALEATKEEEAVYVVMGTVDNLNGEVAAEGQENIKPQDYGPHRLELWKKPEIEETAPLYTDEDLYILAHAICGEGQCCPDEEQLYIGSVILNRKAHGAYPDSIQGVVFQKGQYACTWDGNYYREPTEANWRNARWLLENGSVLPGNVVYQAGFRQGSGMYLQTRYHKYCYR